jgi:hypothetical protein
LTFLFALEMDEDGLCPLCGSAFSAVNDTVITLTTKGAAGINIATKKRKSNVPALKSQDKVHSKCRKDYTNHRKISLHLGVINQSKYNMISVRTLRSSEDPFNSSLDCLFCGKRVLGDQKSQFQTLKVGEEIANQCSRRNDSWSNKVMSRLNSIPDLHAADAIYHKCCSVNFRTGRDVPKEKILLMKLDIATRLSNKAKSGRPENAVQLEAFLKTMS